MRFFALLSIGIIASFCLLGEKPAPIDTPTPVPGLETLQQFNCTPKPCWHGIHLGMTTVQEAAIILSADPTIRLNKVSWTDYYLCWQWQNEWRRDDGLFGGCYDTIPNPDFMLVLNYVNNPLQAGDAITLLGRPTGSFLCTGYDPDDIGYLGLMLDRCG